MTTLARLNRAPRMLLVLAWLGLCTTSVDAQTSTDQVWGQLRTAFTTAGKEGFKQYNYLIGYLDNGTSPSLNWPFELSAGSAYMFVGVCDNDCTDLDLTLEDADRAELASDTAADDLPIIRFTPSVNATYWIRPRMHACSVDPCGYGIGVFVR